VFLLRFSSFFFSSACTKRTNRFGCRTLDFEISLILFFRLTHLFLANVVTGSDAVEIFFYGVLVVAAEASDGL